MVGYNVQTAVDTTNHLIVAHDNDFSWHGNGRMLCRRRAGAITPMPADQRGAGFRSPFEPAITQRLQSARTTS